MRVLGSIAAHADVPYSGEGKKTPACFGSKMGLNPNSSSLGVDVTFLLFGTIRLRR